MNRYKKCMRTIMKPLPLGHCLLCINYFPVYWSTYSAFIRFNSVFFSLSIAPGGSILEEGEKSTWKTSVCVFEANDEDLKNYVQVLLPLIFIKAGSGLMRLLA